ncbi:MAG: hypothetical protein U1A28_00835, partial [Patescibacteria group bacterium]|nr:hypothetical protein [Patescibacteria group bacterium]
LYFSDVVVCGPSTICLDAMSLDKPVVLIDCYRNPKKEHEKVQLYHYNNFRLIFGADALARATSGDSLVKLIEEAIKNPSRRGEGRERVRRAYCGPLDGRSGERLAAVMLRESGVVTTSQNPFASSS